MFLWISSRILQYNEGVSVMEYDEDDFLMISGIQHFSFCPRQWALIHIDQVWDENMKTMEGNIIHENCHNPDFIETRGEILISRGIRIASRTLGVTGQCDVVEFHRDDDGGGRLYGHNGLWLPFPIEYKRGKTKDINADRLQLCCQAMCLEEMLGVSIYQGALYYHETHRREPVELAETLRQEVRKMLEMMHDYFKRGYIPKVRPKKGCPSCSLKEICLPVICKKKSAQPYYEAMLGSDDV